MEKLMERLREIFASEFPGSRAELDVWPESDRVGGFLVWRGFQDVEQLDRQRQLERALRKNLTRRERMHVTLIMTATPRELAVMRAE